MVRLEPNTWKAFWDGFVLLVAILVIGTAITRLLFRRKP